MKDKYTVEVQEDTDGELFIEFPVELLNQMGWDERTMIEWLIEDDRVVIKEVINGEKS